jgi:hypothetical protein
MIKLVAGVPRRRSIPAAMFAWRASNMALETRALCLGGRYVLVHDPIEAGFIPSLPGVEQRGGGIHHRGRAPLEIADEQRDDGTVACLLEEVRIDAVAVVVPELRQIEGREHRADNSWLHELGSAQGHADLLEPLL